MIDAQYAVDCLRQGFERYIRYKRIDATIDIGPNYVSFYVKDIDNTGKQYMARASSHHLKMQRIADKDEPWKGDNISIAFITPKSKQDSQIRATVRQNAHGTIQPFDITTYQYNNTILDKSDLSSIFHSIVSFLNGQGYSDPFKGTAKQAKVLSRHSNIKPYKAPATPTNISIDSNNNNRITTQNGYGADYVSESKDIYNYNSIKTDNYMRNNKRTIRLTESDLHRIVNESVRKILEDTKGGRKPNHWKKKSEIQESKGSAKRELEDAIQNVLGILHSYILEDFECLDKEEFDNLYSVLSDALHKITASYDYGPYEGEPYHFGY